MFPKKTPPITERMADLLLAFNELEAHVETIETLVASEAPALFERLPPRPDALAVRLEEQRFSLVNYRNQREKMRRWRQRRQGEAVARATETLLPDRERRESIMAQIRAAKAADSGDVQ